MIKAGTLERKYDGISDCAKRVVANEGFSALWKGNAANVVRYFPT